MDISSGQTEPTGLESILDIEQRAQFARLVVTACARMKFDLTNIFEETLIDIVANEGNDPSPLASPLTPTQSQGFDRSRPGPPSRRSTPRAPTTANSSPGLTRIQEKCISSFDQWKIAVCSRVMAVCNSQRECTWSSSQPEHLANETRGVPTGTPEELRRRYSPIHTPLAGLPSDRRSAILESLLLILLSLEHYDARSRTLLLITSASLMLPISVLLKHEAVTATTLIKAAQAAMTAEAESKKRIEDNKVSKRWKVGLASVGGAVLIGITGGLAAPLVAAGVGTILGGLGLGATAAAGLLGAITGSSAIVGALFGAYGGKMTGEMVERYAAEVEDFAFIPMQEHQRRGLGQQDNKLRVTVGISGWLAETEDIVRPWRCLSSDTCELYALRWETEALLDLGASLDAMFSSMGWTFVQYEILKRTVLATLYMALWPVALLKTARLIDNPYSIGRHRSEKAGKVLADALMNHCQGFRPVNLVGYGLGARVIYFCLLELAKRGGCGLVQDVYLMGAPVPTSNIRIWKAIRAVAAGRVVVGYSSNDWILGFLERGSSMGDGIAGLQGVQGVTGIENVDLAKGVEGERIVEGHLRYGEVMGLVLRECDVGSLGDLDFQEVKFEENVLKELRDKEAKQKQEAIDRKQKPRGKAAGQPSIQLGTLNEHGSQQQDRASTQFTSNSITEASNQSLFSHALQAPAPRTAQVSTQSDSLLDLMTLDELSFSPSLATPMQPPLQTTQQPRTSFLPVEMKQEIQETPLQQKTRPLRTMNARPTPSAVKTAPVPEMHPADGPLSMMEAMPIDAEPLTIIEPLSEHYTSSVPQKSKISAEPVSRKYNSFMPQESIHTAEPIAQKYSTFMPQETASSSNSIEAMNTNYNSFMPQESSSHSDPLSRSQNFSSVLPEEATPFPMPVQRSQSAPMTIGDWVQEEEDVDDVMDRVERALAAKKKARAAARKAGR